MTKTFIAATLTFILMDAIWLGFIAKPLYISEYGAMLRLVGNSIKPLWVAAFIVYIVLIGGIMVFVIPRAGGNWMSGLIYGGIFGLVTYGTYDFTNLAVMANWPVMITIIDVLWGIVICAVSSAVGVYFGG